MIAQLRAYLITAVVSLLVGVGGGLGFAWHRWRPQSVVEAPAPAVRQKDSSLVLQRVPDAHAKPQQLVPKGATVERVVSVVVQPKAIEQPPAPIAAESASSVSLKPDSQKVDNVSRGTFLCPPVRVDLTLYRLPDKTERVVASSPDGRVLDSLSIDHPVVNATAPRVLRWSAGPIWGGGDNGVGVNVTRDLGPIRAIGAVLRAPARGPVPVHPVGLLAFNLRF